MPDSNAKSLVTQSKKSLESHSFIKLMNGKRNFGQQNANKVGCVKERENLK